VRKELWTQEEQSFCGSPAQTDTIKVPRAFIERLTDAVCYAARMAKVELLSLCFNCTGSEGMRETETGGMMCLHYGTI
jgi:hypothetical protein